MLVSLDKSWLFEPASQKAVLLIGHPRERPLKEYVEQQRFYRVDRVEAVRNATAAIEAHIGASAMRNPLLIATVTEAVNWEIDWGGR